MSVTPQNILVDGFEQLSEWVTSTVFYAVTIGGVPVPLILVWLVVAGSFFTVRMGFKNVRGFKHAIDIIRGQVRRPGRRRRGHRTSRPSPPPSPAPSGLGNIAGVAVAVSPRRPRRDLLDDRAPASSA